MTEPVIIGNATLYLGDCRDILQRLPKVDAVVTDPPYGIGKRSGTISKERNKNNYVSYEDSLENVISEIIPRLTAYLEIAGRGIVTPGGKAVFYYPPATDIGMAYQPAAVGMTHWGRTTCQPILFYGKDPRCGKTIQPIHCVVTEAPEKCDHPCPKPTGFMKWLVNRASLTGEVIVDPFMGSGTTGVAAVQMGRKFVGIEREPKYFDIACKRIEDAQRQGDLFISA